MAFNYADSEFVSFAVYADVVQRDARLFEANEVLNESYVNQLLAKSSQRLLSKIKADDWWRAYQFERNPSLNGDARLVPNVNPDNIDARHEEFIALNIAHCLTEYILPAVADFGNETSAEVQKIKHWKEAFDDGYRELLEAGDWYDFNADGVISTNEMKVGRANLVRIR